MEKAKIILLLILVGCLLIGLLFGLSKLGDFVNDTFLDEGKKDSDASSDVKINTFYAANLPGARQEYFHTFNNGAVNVYGLSFDGDFYNKDGHLEVKNYGELYLYADENESLDDKADVIVFDYDLWHPIGTPATSFDNYIVQFSNRYFKEFGESGGVGDPVNVFCLNTENQPGNGSYDQPLYTFGNKFNEKVHITVLLFHDKAVYYVNGVYIYEDRNLTCQDSWLGHQIYLSSLAIDPVLSKSESIENGTICIDNVECVKFGDGSGSYKGVLMEYRTNTSLKITDLLEVN